MFHCSQVFGIRLFLAEKVRAVRGDAAAPLAGPRREAAGGGRGFARGLISNFCHIKKRIKLHFPAGKNVPTEYVHIFTY